jgi:hypothetical protein
VSLWTGVKQADNGATQLRAAVSGPSGEQKFLFACGHGPDQTSATAAVHRLMLGRPSAVSAITAYTPEKTSTRTRAATANTIYNTATVTFATNPLVHLGSWATQRVGYLPWWRPPQPQARPAVIDAEHLTLNLSAAAAAGDRYANVLLADEQANETGDFRRYSRRPRRRGYFTHSVHKMMPQLQENPFPRQGIRESFWCALVPYNPNIRQQSSQGWLERFGVSAGGTTFTISPSGAIAPTGALSNLVLKLLAGNISPTGLLAKLVGKPFGGATGPSGVLVKLTLKQAGGTIAPSGALSKLALKALAGTIAPSGLLAKLVSKRAGGSMTATGTLSVTKVVVLALAGAISPSGLLGKRAGKSLAGSASPSGLVAKAAAKSDSGGIAPSGTLSKSIGKRMAGAIAPGGSLLTAIVSVFINVFGFGSSPSGSSSSSPSEAHFNSDPAGSSSSAPTEGRFDSPGPHDV